MKSLEDFSEGNSRKSHKSVKKCICLSIYNSRTKAKIFTGIIVKTLFPSLLITFNKFEMTGCKIHGRAEFVQRHLFNLKLLVHVDCFNLFPAWSENELSDFLLPTNF